jgi:hypothetical protein
MPTFKDRVPLSDNVLFVLYDSETTQETKVSESATLHVQQFCSQCETPADIDVDCQRCGKRRHSFRDDTVGAFLSYLCKSRP